MLRFFSCFFSLATILFISLRSRARQTILWSATASYGGTPRGSEIYATRTTRWCLRSGRSAWWLRNIASTPCRIFRSSGWAAWARMPAGSRRRLPDVKSTSIRRYRSSFSPLSQCNLATRVSSIFRYDDAAPTGRLTIAFTVLTFSLNIIVLAVKSRQTFRFVIRFYNVLRARGMEGKKSFPLVSFSG